MPLSRPPLYAATAIAAACGPSASSWSRVFAACTVRSAWRRLAASSRPLASLYAREASASWACSEDGEPSGAVGSADARAGANTAPVTKSAVTTKRDRRVPGTTA